jgi:ABC-type transport system involved in cytochrome c biogenesis ATPase subunit
MLLWADGVTVARGRTILLEGFSMKLEPGELVHLRGANGCGKSSLMRLLAGVVEPRRGSVVRQAQCLFVPERATLPDSLPARRWLRVCGAGDAELPRELDRRCGALSNGQQQRIVLTAALHDSDSSPRVVLLDEPWAGLDADARDALDARLARFAERGSAVLYADHGHETALVPSRTVDLTERGFESGPVGGRVRVQLRRGDERTHVVISDRELAGRLSDGWKVDRIDPAQ